MRPAVAFCRTTLATRDVHGRVSLAERSSTFPPKPRHLNTMPLDAASLNRSPRNLGFDREAQVDGVACNQAEGRSGKGRCSAGGVHVPCSRETARCITSPLLAHVNSELPAAWRVTQNESSMTSAA